MERRLECTIIGRVQMVMFRDFVTRKARALGLVGTVQNNPNGTVSVVAQGEEDSLKKLVVLLHKGPLLARVEKVEEHWSDPLGKFTSFDILY